MFNIPNMLSLARLPLAFLFIPDSLWTRTLVLFLALASDGLDGYWARRYRQSSLLGTLLDPLMDKFFVCVVLWVLLLEQSITPWLALTLLSRDIAVLLYGLFLMMRGRLTKYQFRAIWCGKITTCMQFAVFAALLYRVEVPLAVYLSFVVLGVLALAELYFFDRSEVEKRVTDSK